MRRMRSSRRRMAAMTISKMIHHAQPSSPYTCAAAATDELVTGSPAAVVWHAHTQWVAFSYKGNYSKYVPLTNHTLNLLLILNLLLNSIQVNIVTGPTYPKKFTQGNVTAPFQYFECHCPVSTHHSSHFACVKQQLTTFKHASTQVFLSNCSLYDIGKVFGSNCSMLLDFLVFFYYGMSKYRHTRQRHFTSSVKTNCWWFSTIVTLTEYPSSCSMARDNVSSAFVILYTHMQCMHLYFSSNANT